MTDELSDGSSVSQHSKARGVKSCKHGRERERERGREREMMMMIVFGWMETTIF